MFAVSDGWYAIGVFWAVISVAIFLWMVVKYMTDADFRKDRDAEWREHKKAVGDTIRTVIRGKK